MQHRRVIEKLQAIPRYTRSYEAGVRYYNFEGHTKPYPSVTSVLGVVAKPHLQTWHSKLAKNHLTEGLENMPELETESDKEKWRAELVEDAFSASAKVGSEAAEFGSKAHELFDSMVAGRRPYISPAYTAVCRNFQAFLDDSRLQLIAPDTVARTPYRFLLSATDPKVFSPHYGFAGAFDALAVTERGLALIDWKTSKSVQQSYAWQLAAYAQALHELTGVKVDEALVVKVNKQRPGYSVYRASLPSQPFRALVLPMHGQPRTLYNENTTCIVPPSYVSDGQVADLPGAFKLFASAHRLFQAQGREAAAKTWHRL